MTRSAAPAAALLATLAATTPVHAGCTQRADASVVKQSVSRQVRCNDRRLRHGPATPCKLTAPPACAGTLVADATRLGYGPNDPPGGAVDAHAGRAQLKCQRQIGKGIASYVGTKLRGLVRNDNIPALEPKARKHLDRIPDRCLVNVEQDAGSGLLVPAVGVQCGAAVGAGGTPVQGSALRDCVHTLLQVWVDRWGPNAQALRPNIVFILSDDQRWDTTDGTHSSTGASVMPRTRAELAEKGVEFTQAFMTTPLCCPSRSSILTGEYSHRTGVYKNGGNNGGADDFNDTSTVATWLQAAGYRTSLIGKYLNGYNALWDPQTQPPYVPPGWTDWYGMRSVNYYNYKIVEPDGMGGYTLTAYGNAPADYSTDVLREKAKAFISDAVARNQRFFLYLALKAPHLPQVPAPRHEGMFQGIPPWRPPSYNEADVSDKPTWVQNTPLMTPADQADLDQVRIDQLEMLQAVDEAIGGSTTYGITGIVEHLQNLGVLDDTLIVYFSDNGWYWGEHRFRAKNKPYEEAIRAPMFLRYAKLAPLPRKEARFALNIDLASTFAELVGAGVPIFQDGMSLMHVIDGTQPAWRTDFLTEGWPGGHPWATVREAQWKYTETPLTPGSPTTLFQLELYDLVNDPYELTNVASDPQHAARIAQMAARLRELRQFWPVDSDPNGPDPEEDE